ncbi:hypothetical protein SAMN05216326_15211 [Nitrosomonas marina]|uniref:Uncharacterized protein n=1 Tax=Nitrosomonas marina TaxID=917 RepID=A0A1I0G342_9PROT|nr:hypothetical protein [Nitrosomonas marina]SET65148.1 hypothetical protein SAMN05216326_15211 [Nitrosomonas marina]
MNNYVLNLDQNTIIYALPIYPGEIQKLLSRSKVNNISILTNQHDENFPCVFLFEIQKKGYFLLFEDETLKQPLSFRNLDLASTFLKSIGWEKRFTVCPLVEEIRS